MNAHDVAAERRLEAFLGEAMGGDDAAELAARVLQRLRSEPPPQRRARQYAVAALMLVGIAVVAAVAWLQREGAARTVAAQDPQRGEAPVALVNDAVLPAPVLVDVAMGADVAQEILRVSQRAYGSVVVDGAVDGKVARAITRAPWREAVAALAAGAGAGVEEVDGILVVRTGARPLPYAVRATFGSDTILLRDFAKVVSLRCGVDVVVAEDLQGRVRCDLKAASWRDALDVAARQLGGEVVGCGQVLALRRRVESIPAKGAMTFPRADLGPALDILAHMYSRNVVVGRGLGPVAARFDHCAPTAMFRALARASGVAYRHEGGIDRFEAQHRASDPLAVLTAENIDLRTFAELVRSAADATVAVPDDCARRLTVFAGHAPLRDLLAAAALATGRTFVDDDKRGLVIE